MPAIRPEAGDAASPRYPPSAAFGQELHIIDKTRKPEAATHVTVTKLSGAGQVA
jgi:hypothetical protein